MALPNGPQGSHVITSLVGADALALIPSGERNSRPGNGGGADSRYPAERLRSMWPLLLSWRWSEGSPPAGAGVAPARSRLGP